jgi:hypothetical protein
MSFAATANKTNIYVRLSKYAGSRLIPKKEDALEKYEKDD